MEKIPPLVEAVLNNDIELVKTLLDKNADLNESLKRRENTPLHIATIKRYKVITKILLKAGADVKMKNIEGQTALHVSEDEIISQALIDYGSDVCGGDKKNCTPLHSACAGKGDVKTIKCLLKNGANINALDLHGRTPIMHVLGHPDLEVQSNPHPTPHKILPFLLKYSDINVIDRHGKHILNTGPLKAGLFMVLHHIAKLKVQNQFIHPSILNEIFNDKISKNNFSVFIQDLLEAKATKLSNSWVSYFHLLTDSKKRLIKYAGNRNLLEDFKKSDVINKFPFYGKPIHERFSKAIETRKIWDNVAVTMSNLLPIFDSYHLIIRNIIDCLTTKDLSKLN